MESSEDPASIQELVDVLWRSLRGWWSAAAITLLLVNLPAFTPPCASVVRANFEDPPGALTAAALSGPP